MGNGTYYGLNDPEYYTTDGTVITDSNGLSGKVVTEMGDTDYHSSPPTWAKKSELYFKRSDEGSHEIEQMRVFNKERRVVFDFDWGHKHKDMPKGVVHVHVWYENKNGNWSRGKPRCMNAEEIQKYGVIIHKAFSGAKFHP